MRLTYIGPDIDGVEVPDLLAVVPHGEPVDVPDELAGRLLEQPVWTAAPRDVLAAAGDDPARAERLLDAERRRDEPRDALLAELEQVAAPAVAAEEAGDEVPDAKADVVLAWVEADPNPPDRARRALAAEQQRDRPRANVTEPLQQLLADEGTDGP